MILNTVALKGVRNKIALDIGNILINVDMDVFLKELLHQDIIEDSEEGYLFMESTQHVLDIGVYDINHSLRLHFPKIGKQKIKSLIDAWMEIVTPCKPTLEVLSELTAEGAEVALLSNIGLDHAKYLSDMCAEQFDQCTKHFSCYVGARKPTKLFYQSFMMDNPSFNDGATRALFLDDRIENVQASKKYLNGRLFDIEKFDTEEAAALGMISIIQDI